MKREGKMNDTLESKIFFKYAIDGKGKRIPGLLVGRTDFKDKSTGYKVNIRINDNDNWLSSDGVNKVRTIKIEKKSSKRFTILVDGCGPDKGTRTFRFTDDEGDNYKLNLTSTTPKEHYLNYRSSAPDIKAITWDRYDE